MEEEDNEEEEEEEEEVVAVVVLTLYPEAWALARPLNERSMGELLE